MIRAGSSPAIAAARLGGALRGGRAPQGVYIESMRGGLDDPARRAAMGEAARRRVRGEFTAELMVRRTPELYREIAAAHGLG